MTYNCGNLVFDPAKFYFDILQSLPIFGDFVNIFSTQIKILILKNILKSLINPKNILNIMKKVNFKISSFAV